MKRNNSTIISKEHNCGCKCNRIRNRNRHRNRKDNQLRKSEYKVASQEAEWIPPKIILTHEPGMEMNLGLCHPIAALYEGTFDATKLQSQHQEMRLTFKKILNDCQILTIDEILKGMIDVNKLRQFVLTHGCIKYDLSGIEFEDKNERELEISKQNRYMKKVIFELKSDSLAQIILLRPTVVLSKDDKNTYFKADYKVSPILNLLFMRDPLITTKKGIVIGAMNSKQRYDETELIRFIIEELGYKIILNVHEIGLKMDSSNIINIPKLEGGDFIAVGDYAFIGQGLRTNSCAIELLLKNNVFGTKYVIVVKDEWRNQQEMHLDTYFNVLGKNCCVLSQWRKIGLKSGQKYNTLIDMYKLKYDEYIKIMENVDFYQFLTKNVKFNVVLVSEKDQEKYAINFLTVGDKKIVGVKGASNEYMKQLESIGVNAKWIDISDMTRAYGAIHCTTQPIVRCHGVESLFWYELEQAVLNSNVIALVLICFFIVCAVYYYFYFYYITKTMQATI